MAIRPRTFFPAYNNEVQLHVLSVCLMRKKFQMECFWNYFGTVTKVSKENGFHGNLVTKQNE